MKRLTPKDFTEMPWLNGGGTTLEIGRESDDHGMIWRISTAVVEADCYYSLFPGLQRRSAVVEGNGVQLTCTKTQVVSRVEPAEIAVLSGDALYQGVLIDGEFRHLNLVYNAERTSAEIEWIETGTVALPEGATHYVYCSTGDVAGADGLIAHKGEVLLSEGNESVHLSDGARAVRISIAPTS